MCQNGMLDSAVLLRNRIQQARMAIRMFEERETSASPCFELTKCTEMGGRIVGKDAVLRLPLGMGEYTSPDEWCAFIGLTTLQVSKHALFMVLSSAFGDADISFPRANRIEFSLKKSQLRIFSKSYAPGGSSGGFPTLPLKVAFEFEGSSTTILSVELLEAPWHLVGGHLLMSSQPDFSVNVCLWMEDTCGLDYTICEAKMEALPVMCQGLRPMEEGSRSSFARDSELALINKKIYCPRILALPEIVPCKLSSSLVALMETWVAEQSGIDPVGERGVVC